MTHVYFSGFLQEAGDEGWLFLHEQVQAHHQEPLHLLHSPRLQVHLLIGQSLQEQHLTSCHTVHALKTFLVIANRQCAHSSYVPFSNVHASPFRYSGADPDQTVHLCTLKKALNLQFCLIYIITINSLYLHLFIPCYH